MRAFWPALPTLSLNFKGEGLNLEAKWVEVRARVWHIVVKGLGIGLGLDCTKEKVENE